MKNPSHPFDNRNIKKLKEANRNPRKPERTIQAKPSQAKKEKQICGFFVSVFASLSHSPFYNSVSFFFSSLCFCFRCFQETINSPSPALGFESFGSS
jgi:hypothetical protein